MWKVYLIFILLFKLSFGNYIENWNGILKTHSKFGKKLGIEAVLLDYEGIKADIRWRNLLEDLRSTYPEGYSEDEAKAFWINVYNIGAVKIIIDNHPLKSIKDAGSLFKPVWGKKVIQVGNKNYSLGHIEHNILRKTGDPLIHYAIVCASMSCPDLRGEAYTGDRLDEQMAEQKNIFIANREKGVHIEGDTYYISKLYKWYEEDFGDPYTYLEIPKNKKVKFMDYNWSLNSQ